MVTAATPGGVDVEAKSGIRGQTLDRALDELDLLADGQARSSHDLAAAAVLHRFVIYRIPRTLEDRELVRRFAEGASRSASTCWC
jgi:hypothetical protein